MKKQKRTNRVLLGLAIATILIATAISLVFLDSFVGWFYHAADAGSITAINIHHTYTADAWHGFAGMAYLDMENNQTNWSRTVTGGTTTVIDLPFNCFGKSGWDVYISPVPADQLDLSTVQPATPAEIDAYIGIDPSERISATRSYTENFTLNLGSIQRTGPGLRTKSVGNLTNVFHQAAFKDANGVIFFGANASKAIPGYDGHIHNFQMMVPVPYNQTDITYYLFPDPITDELGHCSAAEYAVLEGWVTDRASGTPLPNVTVQVGDAITQTDMGGYYDVLAAVGSNFVLAFKTDFFDYVNFTMVVSNITNQHNFSLVPTLNQTSLFQYGYITGIVSNYNGTPLENVTILSGLFSTLTNAQGNYTLIAPEGNETMVVAMAEGYRTNVTSVNVEAFQTVRNDIILSELPVVFGGNGTVYGLVTDGDTGLGLGNTTVRIGSWSTTTNDTGHYRISVPSYSFYYIIAYRQLYDPYIGSLTENNSVMTGAVIEYNMSINMSNYLTGLFNLPPGDIGPYTEPPGQQGISNITEQVQQESLWNGTGLLIEDIRGKIAAYLSIRQIKTHIKQDSFVEQTIAFYNFKDEDLDLKLEIQGEEIAGIVEISKDTLSVTPNEYGELELTISGTKPPGVYTGKLLVSGGIDVELPIEVRISKEGKIPIKTLMMNLDVLKKVVVQGTPIQYKLDLVNLFTDRKYKVDLKFYVANLNGTRLTDMQEKSITLETFTSLVGQITVPDDFPPDDYIIRAQADYLGLTSTTDALFTVREPFYAYDLFGIVPVWLLATLLALVAMALFSAQEIKRRQDAKKRFHAKVEYDELPQEGDRSAFVGMIAETNKRSYFDIDRLTVHSIVAGSTGGGKSISAQDIIEECLIKGVAVAVFDPTAQWSGMLRKLEDKKFLEFYTKFGMDPKKDPRGFNGNIKAVKNGREIIDIFKYLRPGEIQIFTTNTLDPKDYDIFVASMIQQIFHSKLDEFRGLKYLLVFDEIHRILPKFGGSGAGFTQIERGCREFRKWGIGIVLISQVLSDFVGEIKANINTLVQMKTRDEGDLNRIKMQYGEEYIQSLVKSPVGSGMVQNSSWNRGKPYYVTFRPILHSVVRLTDEELDKYNQYNEVVEQLDYEFDQLEQLGQDVFDLRLELKLSKDKIKSGNFNMVQIYLDGLTPRVLKMWDKLGKKPKKLEIQLMDATAIDEAVKKAKEEKAKKEKEA
ncbi:TPA: DUF87 domain-containing protein, partial [Candidatus Woesearchaeota archaeon]|nr:DUF87 domain-containing protein [Candidatus Woesearchaeota archaeon]